MSGETSIGVRRESHCRRQVAEMSSIVIILIVVGGVSFMATLTRRMLSNSRVIWNIKCLYDNCIRGVSKFYSKGTKA